ncbi:MAG: AraC family transcriptional regulator [Bacteroidia bacterium]|jgi:AraC-like DNA-binding protein|nr:AraC family transcriptional regulator [Bacteroidia bacterium]
MPFSFNFYSSLLLLPFVQGLLFSILLLVRSRRKQRLNDALMAVLLLVLTITVSFWMLGFAGWYDSHDGYTVFMFYFPFNLLLLAGPAIWFYFLSTVNASFRFTRKDWLHAVLPLLLLLLYVVKFAVDFLTEYPFPATEEFQFGTRGTWAQIDKSLPVKFISFASVFYYLWLTLRQFTRYKTYLNQNFSETDSLSLAWLRRMLLAAGAGLLLFFLFFLWNIFADNTTYKFNWTAYFGLGILIYYLSIYSYQFSPPLLHHLGFKDNSTDLPTPEATAPADEIAGKLSLLKELMEQHCPFLDPELTLAQLAKLAGTNTATLSKVINSGMGQNFNDYINGLRIKEFQARLQKGDHNTQTLMAVAFDSGFNSKATFNRAFRKVTGKNPSEWIKEDMS